MKERDKDKTNSLISRLRDASIGSLADPTVPNAEEMEQFRQELMVELHKSQQERADLEKNLEEKGLVSPQMLVLLKTIHTSTFGDHEGVSLLKIKAILELQEGLSRSGIGDEPVVYLGAGIDWRLPVALGARTIDMVDEMFSKQEGVEALFEDIKAFALDAALENSTVIHFGIDLGDGVEDVFLRTFGQDVKDYSPPYSLTGVIEICGPSRLLGDGTMPVLPKPAKALADNGFILNFDYDPERLRTESGLDVEYFDGFELYLVNNKQLLTTAAQLAGDKFQGPSIS